MKQPLIVNKVLSGMTSGRTLYGTKEYWNRLVGFVPQKGQLIIYTNYWDEDEENRDAAAYPNTKVGDGHTYIQDLPFMMRTATDEEIDAMFETAQDGQ